MSGLPAAASAFLFGPLRFLALDLGLKRPLEPRFEGAALLRRERLRSAVQVVADLVVDADHTRCLPTVDAATNYRGVYAAWT